MTGVEPKEVWGSHEHKLDVKGRLSIPAEFRTTLGLDENDSVVVTRSIAEKCLLVFWPESWKAFLELTEEADEDDDTADLVDEIMRGYHRRVKLDRLGRIQLPQYLLVI